MKRKLHDPTSWRAKLTSEGIQYLEQYRLQKLQLRERERKEGRVSLLDQAEEMFARTSQPTELTPEMKEFYNKNPAATAQLEKVMSELLGPIPPPSTMELWKGIASILEQVGLEVRMAVSLLLAIGIHNIWGLFHETRKRHFGNSPIGNREFFWIVGTAFQTYADILRTGDLELSTKGRVNVELLDLVQKVRECETKKLSYRELRDALDYVFVFTPNEERLRLFVHRAKKKKWLPL
jgi:hypothetical protein